MLALGSRAGLSRTQVLATVVLERAFDVIVLVALLVVAAPFLPSVDWLNAAVALGAVAGTALIAAAVLVRRYGVRGARVLLRPVGWLPGVGPERVEGMAKGFVTGLVGITASRVAVRALAVTLVSWLVLTCSIWLLLLGTEMDASFGVALLILIATNLVLVLPSGPAAVGTFEAAVVVSLAAYGVDRAEALSFALVLTRPEPLPVPPGRLRRAGPALTRDAGALMTPRRLRAAALLGILAWFFLPELQRAVPIWLPFLGVVALELNFLVAALREEPLRARRGRGPQDVDLEDFGGEEWLEPVLVQIDGRDVWLPATGKSDEELAELIEEARERIRRGEPPVEPPPLRPRPRQRRLPSLLEGFAVVAVAAVILFVLLPDRGWSGLSSAEQQRTERLLSEEAAEIAGHEVDVRCDASGQAVGIVQHADGVAEVGGRRALLTPAICYRLHRLRFEGDEGSFSQTARAIAVLAHEAWHLRGESDEGVTNCYAFQSGVALGQRLGLSEATAARMMRQQLADNATYARSAPAYLVPGECRDGGYLDLAPGTGRFP